MTKSNKLPLKKTQTLNVFNAMPIGEESTTTSDTTTIMTSTITSTHIFLR